MPKKTWIARRKGTVFPKLKRRLRTLPEIQVFIKRARRQLLLQSWKVELNVISRDAWGDNKTGAFVEINKKYKLVKLNLCSDQMDLCDEDMMWMIRHELAHVIQDMPEEQCVEHINTLVGEYEEKLKEAKRRKKNG